MTITGNTLRLARIIYDIHSQEAMGEILEVTLGTIQRYEAMEEVDIKIKALYREKAFFDLEGVAASIKQFRLTRNIMIPSSNSNSNKAVV